MSAATARAQREHARQAQEERRQERQRAQAERAYEQLSGAQRAELEAAVWERLPEWLRRRIDQEELAQAPATAAIVDTMRQRVLQEWLAEGKLKEPKGCRSRHAELQTWEPEEI